MLVERRIALRRLGPAVYGDGDLGRLFVRVRGRIVPVPFRDVHYFAADGDHVALHLADRTFRVFVPLKELEEHLDGRFLRVRRSHLVNLDCVDRFERHDRRRLAVVLRDGTRLVASRRCSRRLRERTL
jgi:two-component system LytT family response regulator